MRLFHRLLGYYFQRDDISSDNQFREMCSVNGLVAVAKYAEGSLVQQSSPSCVSPVTRPVSGRKQERVTRGFFDTLMSEVTWLHFRSVAKFLASQAECNSCRRRCLKMFADMATRFKNPINFWRRNRFRM